MTGNYHEPAEELSSPTRDMQRALSSLMEELQAVDWYQQRIDVTSDDELRSVLAHNRDEEIEHAAMILEWLRRRMPQFDTQLRTYLFTSAPITQVEEAAGTGTEDGGTDAHAGVRGLGLGKFTKEE